MATEANAKHKETYLGKQKNVGMNLMGKSIGCKGNRDAKQYKAAGEDLELVHGPKGSQLEDKEHGQQYKNMQFS